MNTKRLLLSIILLSAIALNSCGGENYPTHNWEWNDNNGQQNIENNPSIVEQGWVRVTDFGKLPSYISVYKSPDSLEDTPSIAYIAVADMSEAKFEVLGDVGYSESAGGYVGESLNSPMDFYRSCQSPIIINAGLFYSAQKGGKTYYYSQNLVVRNGVMLAPNQNYYSKDWVTMWYPTVGAFCMMKDGLFQTTWTYYAADGNNYYYPAPAQNDINMNPLQIPSATFPVGGKLLDATTAIGGITVLIRAGNIENTFREEMLDVSAETNQPRTAIGITEDKKMILFVCEGRNQTPGVLGLSTGKVAEVMKKLGCVEALNLDGGGSSCMLVNGHETIKCSDGKQRKVLTAIGLK